MPKQIHVHTKFLFVLLLTVPLLYTSCISKKMKEKKLVGTWEEIIYIDTVGATTEQWVFSNDGLINIFHKNDTTLSLIYTGEWAIQQKVGSAYLSLAVEPPAYYSFYEISKIKKNALVLSVQDGGQYLREFEKVE